jgi:hypothetical protein
MDHSTESHGTYEHPPIVAVLSLATVEYGGWALLSFISGREGLADWQSASSEPGTHTRASSSYLRLSIWSFLPRGVSSDY